MKTLICNNLCLERLKSIVPRNKIVYCTINNSIELTCNKYYGEIYTFNEKVRKHDGKILKNFA